MSERLKVLVVSYLFPNSEYPNRGIFVLKRQLEVAENVDVKVINPIPWFPGASALRRYRGYHRIPIRTDIEGLDVFHPRFLAVPKIMKSLAAKNYANSVFQIAAELRKIWSFDIVDLNWTFPDLVAGDLLKKQFQVPYAVSVRGNAALPVGRYRTQSKTVSTYLPEADHVFALSNALRQKCIDLGVDRKRSSVLGNGVDHRKFFHVQQQEARRKIGFDDRDYVVLGVGYLTHNKGFDRVIDAIAALRRDGVRIRLALCGPNGDFSQGDCSHALKELANSKGVSDSVQWVGEVPNSELRWWYSAADCFCLSSRSEGCPNVLLEALACGCPVVATDVGSAHQSIERVSGGMTVANSKDGVLDGLRAMANTKFDREELAQRSSVFGWDQTARAVIQVFESLLNPIANTKKHRALELEA